MANPIVMATLSLLTFLGLLFVLFPSSLSQTSAPVGKAPAGLSADTQQDGEYLVGVGKADITG